MANDYHQLLDATIQHLEELKSRGVRFVAASPRGPGGGTQSTAPDGAFEDRFCEARARAKATSLQATTG